MADADDWAGGLASMASVRRVWRVGGETSRVGVGWSGCGSGLNTSCGARFPICLKPSRLPIPIASFVTPLTPQLGSTCCQSNTLGNSNESPIAQSWAGFCVLKFAADDTTLGAIVSDQDRVIRTPTEYRKDDLVERGTSAHT